MFSWWIQEVFLCKSSSCRHRSVTQISTIKPLFSCSSATLNQNYIGLHVPQPSWKPNNLGLGYSVNGSVIITVIGGHIIIKSPRVEWSKNPKHWGSGILWLSRFSINISWIYCSWYPLGKLELKEFWGPRVGTSIIN